MNASTRNKSDRMLAAQVRKLVAAWPDTLTRWGFVRVSERDETCVRTIDARTKLSVRLIADESDGRVWLATRFVREYPRPDLPWDAKENHAIYQDLHERYGANKFSGKVNDHVFERLTAAQAIVRFDAHIEWLLGE